MTTDTDDAVVVVGAGVIGLAAAWRLTRRGRRVTVLDPAPARAASHAAAGMLAPVTEVKYGEEPLLALGIESLRRYPAFVGELEAATGLDVGLRTDGTLLVATDAGDRAMLSDLHDFQRSLGLDADLLTSRECRALEPGLSPDVRCGLLARSDHSIDNRKLVAALLAALDGSVRPEAAAAIDLDDDVVTGVTLRSGERIETRTVVLAAGPWSADIDGLPDAARPKVRPVKGEILRLRARAHGAELPTRSLRGFVNGHEVYLVPRADGELVVGATVEEMGFDTSVRVGAVRELLRDGRAVFPGIDELELVESLAAHRPGSPDNRPIIGTTDVDGLVLATGHFRNGVLLAAVTADLVADTIMGDSRDVELAALVSPHRFAGVRA
ncbi:MAG TPA: glycine oxidase ThiO [Mycobacteriales bacterium]|nr:glycine oxidase ThiO [Mycobacteriales bacterium]HVX69316.1 glycine oxidase ThiO [Mycobacteriales bacterium]